MNNNNRYLALDAFRGITIALMILVNTPGTWSHVFSPLLHADWHGVTPTDLIFPFFLFIIGSALYFAFSKSNFEFSPLAVAKIIKRSAIIFLIGLGLNVYSQAADMENLRVMGVLQRLGIAYGIGAVLVLLLTWRQLIIACVAILMSYWLLMTMGSNAPYSLEHNVVRSFDLVVLGENHLWQGKGIAFDPEGLLSTLPAIVNVLTGFLATMLLAHAPSKIDSIKRLSLFGAMLIVISLLWNVVMPINKSLWTSSYVVFSTGCAFFVLAFFIWLVDIKAQLKLVDPLLVYGSNPLFIYVLSWLWVATYQFIAIGNITLYQYLYEQLAVFLVPKVASFAFAFIHVAIFWFISNVLYRRSIFIKV